VSTDDETSIERMTSSAVDHWGELTETSGVPGGHATSPKERPMKNRLPSKPRDSRKLSCVGECGHALTPSVVKVIVRYQTHQSKDTVQYDVPPYDSCITLNSHRQSNSRLSTEQFE